LETGTLARLSGKAEDVRSLTRIRVTFGSGCTIEFEQ